MNRSVCRVMMGIAGSAVLGMSATLAGAQTVEVKEKPPLYRYVSYWTLPRAHWADVDKDHATGNQKILAPALADGTLVGRARLYARKGSACLPDGRVLIVDRREVGTFALPDLRPLWHRRLPMTIQSAAFCGGKIAILPTSTSDLTFVEVPP